MDRTHQVKVSSVYMAPFDTILGPSCSFPKLSARLGRPITTSRSSRRAGSGPVRKWRRAWRWARRGGWTGSVWLATTESECSQIFREKRVAARSRDTVRSKGRTGKYSRQLVSAWTEAWEGAESPGALPMPMQSLIAEPAIARATRAAEGGNARARELVTYFVGQGVGMVEGVTSARSVVQDFMTDYADAVETLNAAI